MESFAYRYWYFGQTKVAKKYPVFTLTLDSQSLGSKILSLAVIFWNLSPLFCMSVLYVQFHFYTQKLASVSQLVNLPKSGSQYMAAR